MPTEEESDFRKRLVEALDEDGPLSNMMSEEETPSLRKRLVKASLMGQEPTDRIWTVIFAISSLVFIIGGLVVESRFFLSRADSWGFKRGAVDCLILVVDDDRDFGLPDYCHHDNLVIYYPSGICDQFFADDRRCGLEEQGQR